MDLDMLQKQVVLKNETLYIHVIVETDNPLHNEELMNARHKQVL